jgi:hypothetical protein
VHASIACLLLREDYVWAYTWKCDESKAKQSHREVPTYPESHAPKKLCAELGPHSNPGASQDTNVLDI